jgi:glycosyltransferase involved in cell wall biosynthesis
VVFPPGDIEGMINALNSLLDNADLARRLAVNAGNAVMRYDSRIIIERIHRLYREAVAHTA